MATTAIRPSQPARRGTGAEARLLHGQVRLALFSSHSRPPVETITTPQGQVALAGTSGPPLTLLLLGGGVRGAPTPRPSVYTAPRPAPLTCLGRDTDPRANLRRPGRSQQVSGAASSFCGQPARLCCRSPWNLASGPQPGPPLPRLTFLLLCSMHLPAASRDPLPTSLWPPRPHLSLAPWDPTRGLAWSRPLTPINSPRMNKGSVLCLAT